eukprot:PhM_4_TR753/c0_g1_i1/m.95590
MLRRFGGASATTTSCGLIATTRRFISKDSDAITVRGPPLPPMHPREAVTPIDFNPHIDWFEFPKEIFDPKYPFTREECITARDEYFFTDADELAEKYGVRISNLPTAYYWLVYFMWMFYMWYELWSLYRAQGSHPSYFAWEHVIQASPHCPTVTDDEVYLDQWVSPHFRQKEFKFDRFWQWKPPTKEGVENPWAIKLERKDPSEWRHMTSKY